MVEHFSSHLARPPIISVGGRARALSRARPSRVFLPSVYFLNGRNNKPRPRLASPWRAIRYPLSLLAVYTYIYVRVYVHIFTRQPPTLMETARQILSPVRNRYQRTISSVPCNPPSVICLPRARETVLDRFHDFPYHSLTLDAFLGSTLTQGIAFFL